MVKTWENRAFAFLDKSLAKIPIELNELDWKTVLSNNTSKFAKHLSAFSHLSGGGFIVFGIFNDGSFTPELKKEEVDKTIKLIGNIANNNLNISITIDHTIMEYNGHNLLVVFIPESTQKPVYLKGNDLYESYKRSAGQTIKCLHLKLKGLL